MPACWFCRDVGWVLCYKDLDPKTKDKAPWWGPCWKCGGAQPDPQEQAGHSPQEADREAQATQDPLVG